MSGLPLFVFLSYSTFQALNLNAHFANVPTVMKPIYELIFAKGIKESVYPAHTARAPLPATTRSEGTWLESTATWQTGFPPSLDPPGLCPTQFELLKLALFWDKVSYLDPPNRLDHLNHFYSL